VPNNSARRLRVVFLDHTAAASGAELALLTTLQHLDVDRHVVLGADGALRPAFAAVAGLDVMPMPPGLEQLTRDSGGAATLAPHLAGYCWRLARHLRNLSPDVVYANSLRSGVYGGFAARLAGVPLVWHVRDRLTADYLGERQAVLIRRLVRHLSTQVIANSAATASTVPIGVPVTVVPSPLPLPSSHARRPAGGPRTYVSASRLSPWKGQDLFLTSFAQAFPDGDQLAVVLGAAHFGEEEYVRHLHDRVRELGLQHRVTFRGHCDDVLGELAGCDVLVHSPLLPEPFGRVVVEGMAAGLTVIARGDGGPAETVTDGVDGLLYDPGDPDQLVQLLRRVDGDVDLRKRLGTAALQRARDFSPERIVPRIHRVLQQVVRPERLSVAG
jgi:glycosyltransferase involved in cell wall biosynthesis